MMRPVKESQSSDAASDPVIPVREGDVVAGKYRIERLLGAGGMGAVFAATHISLEQRVALKFLTHKSRNPEVLQRFTREARAAVKIQSEHVGRVWDVGELDSGVPFFVMEYLEGKDFCELVAQGGPLPIERAVAYVLQACEAIAEAHAAGVVHRDLKPANLFLARRAGGSPIVKVLDFGISKMTSRSSTNDAQSGFSRTDAALTSPSSILGSPLYMAPEQLDATMQVDARTDIWALGVILYELVTGRAPFDASSTPLIYISILQNAPPPLRLRDAPPAFAAVISRCLEKNPSNRYHDVIELIGALAEFSPKQGEASAARVATLERVPNLDPPIVGGRTAVFDAPTVNAWGRSRVRPSRLPRAPLILGGSVLVIAGAIVGTRSWIVRQAPAASAHALVTTPDPEAEAPRATTKPDPVLPSVASAGDTSPSGASSHGSGPLASASSAEADRPAASRVLPPGTPPLPTTSVRPNRKMPPRRTTGFGDRE